MSSLPQHEPEQPEDWPREPQTGTADHPDADHPRGVHPDMDPAGSETTPGPSASHPAIEPTVIYPPAPEPPFFRPWQGIVLRPPERIPNFGHFGVMLLLLFLGLLCTGLMTRAALQRHLFGISTVQHAVTDIHYTLGSEAILYIVTLIACLLVFPLVWRKSFFAGIQWNGSTALRLRWSLVGAAFICFLFALLSGELMPGPSNAPIDKIFRTPGAAWLLFGFGVTFAPFFEEMFFRGFLLPAFCTAFDWFAEQIKHLPVRPLAANGHPRWSFSAMASASIATSIPFALMHGAQTGYAVGPLLLLIGVSIVLCAVRLTTRSLAASVLVHACYNFMLFTLMLIGTGGFRHLQRM
jgi:CAAX protease family protein